MRFIHARDKNRDEVERVLGCPVLYEQDTSETVFHRDDMLLPVPTADRELLRVLSKNADEVIKERAEKGNDFMEVFSERIIDRLSTGQVTAMSIATDLGISQRTISRRLAENNTSFDQLMDDIRQELATSYLNEGNVKVQELAFLLGFSSHASFSAAFKRWTGKTPSEMRTMN